ncbi:ImmA/IrrE family metallo-endopeptidase [Streptomyces sp. TX20-6-3]|uniref:ImmA/IrrE family metallo-endopeptidase n=1 Tax=Streptomyces sp. TX20-6-3 TaxID=3028705 RepID=UPI0029BF30D4|nr:ImmA/IrrE family metallo-endopeptidase [Streptomyces sp. TX20-6-3]MDX2559347.1 ImmA/IrrE family metallo-endopeptidase [Streptomyces sp. TX20-6-3]
MVVRVRVEPALLEWAVERAGWNDATIAQREPRFDDWVNDSVRPTLKQLEHFAHATHTPLGSLFLTEPPDEPVPIPDMRTMANQAVARPSVNLLDTIYSCQSRQDWYREYATSHDLPPVEFAGSVTTDTPPTYVASKITNLLNFSLSQRSNFSSMEEALRKLIDRIENTGVLVVVNGVVGSDTHRRLNPEEFRGFALADRLAPLIFVNGADTKSAQIFTMIHELAHVWLGGSALSDAAMAHASDHDTELWCNRVAAEVLVPLSSMRADYAGSTSTAELERLARRYRVSTLVVLKRLYDARFLTWDDYQAQYEIELRRIFAILQAKRAESTGGNYYNTHPIRLSRRFARAVIADTFEGKTAYRDAYQLLGTKRHQTFQNLVEEIGVA